MKIRVIHVDDEPKALDNFKIITSENFPEVEIVGQASSALVALRLINQEKPDAVFLDISMPGGGGFEILDSLQSINFEVVMLTAYDQFAMKALKKNVLDYILKPIDLDELGACFEKIKSKLTEKRTHPLDNNEKIIFSSHNGLEIVEIDKVIRFEADGNYTKVILISDSLLISKSMKVVEEKLPLNLFYRCHRSHIVNLKHIKKLSSKETANIELSNGDLISLSDNKREELIRIMHLDVL